MHCGCGGGREPATSAARLPGKRFARLALPGGGKAGKNGEFGKGGDGAAAARGKAGKAGDGPFGVWTIDDVVGVAGADDAGFEHTVLPPASS